MSDLRPSQPVFVGVDQLATVVALEDPVRGEHLHPRVHAQRVPAPIHRYDRPVAVS